MRTSNFSILPTVSSKADDLSSTYKPDLRVVQNRVDETLKYCKAASQWLCPTATIRYELDMSCKRWRKI